MKRRKPAAARKETSIRFRVSEQEKAALENAATEVHMDLSVWIRFVTFKEAGIIPDKPKAPK